MVCARHFQAIYASDAGVSLLQVAFRSNTPNSYAGGTFNPECYGGYFHNTSTKSCDQCQAGSVKSDGTDLRHRTATSCTSCPEGRYGDAARAMTSSAHCVKCPPGYFGEEEAATKCTACPEGRYGQFPGETSPNCTAECPASLVASCTAGTASPLAPIIGFYLANVTTKEQKPCPTGKFKSTLDFEECGICPIGKYTATNASTYCADCAPGLHAATNTSDGCIPCDESTGHYQDHFGQGECKSCSALTCIAARASCGGASAGYCVDSSPGRAIAGDGCSECTGGHYQPDTNQIQCLKM